MKLITPNYYYTDEAQRLLWLQILCMHETVAILLQDTLPLSNDHNIGYTKEDQTQLYKTLMFKPA